MEPKEKIQFQTQLEQIQLIAEGGMSLIYKARQKNLERDVVLKKLKPVYSASNELIQRFQREARSLARVLHQNVAHVYEFIEENGEHYLLMEYIDGVDLSKVNRKVAPLSPTVAVAIALGVARGLCAIHNRHLVHRDIKPSNIRITTRGEVKLMDFGIVADTQSHALTRPGVLVGSPSYLSPEQILGDAVTPKSDMFLVGICLYEMLTGSRPFQDQGDENVFQKIRQVAYTPLQKKQASVPQSLVKIVERCLQKDPQKRFETTEDLVAELEHFLGPIDTSQAPKLILSFLDAEALLNASTSIAPRKAPSKADPKARTLPKWLLWSGAASLLFCALVAGYGIGKYSSFQINTPQNYSPPKALKPKR